MWRLKRGFGRGARVVWLGSQNIHENLALEQHLYSGEKLERPTLLLYRNDKTIVIGKHQNPWKECHLDRIAEDGVVLARRKSGGGAVYQDLGNTCFGFLTPIFDETAPLDTRQLHNQILLKALHSLGIDAKVSGRNDMEVGGKKFSGSAYELDLGGKHTQKKALHHGTLLLNTDFTQLHRYLNPSAPKLKSKGVDSVVARVVNLCTLVPSLDHETVGRALVREFLLTHKGGPASEERVDKPLDYHPAVGETYRKWTDPQWVIGQTPQFSNNIEQRFGWGGLDVYLDVQEGRIVAARVYSDSLLPELVDSLSHELNSKHYLYTEEGINSFREVLLFRWPDQPQAGMVEDICRWLGSTVYRNPSN